MRLIKAREYEVTVILDPAPAQGITVENLKYADILIPNRQEALSLSGLACAIADGESLVSAAHFATIVSALIVTRHDAQDFIPTLAEVNEFCALRNIKHYLSD